MKIALPTRGREVDSHFGHCESFTIFTVNESNEIVGEERITPPAGCGCKSNIVHTLSAMGVKVMLAGNMGDGAVQILREFGIKVVRGCSGDVRSAVNSFLSGTLGDSGETCRHHGHDGHGCSHN